MLVIVTCQFNAKPTHGNCEGVSGYHIVTGRYGTTVRLDGLNMALIASLPRWLECY